MRFKSWLKRKKEFEAEMPVDNPDVKVVTTSYKGKPFFVGVGISKQREVKGSGQFSPTEGAKGEYQSQKDLDWQLFYNLGALPSGFIPAEKVKDFMAGTVAVTSGNATVYSPQTEFKEVDSEKLKKMETGNRIYSPKTDTIFTLKQYINAKRREEKNKVHMKSN